MPVLLAALRSAQAAPAAGRRVSVAAVLGAIVAVPIAAALLAYGVPPVPGELYAFGRTIMNPFYEPKMLYVGEGMNASVAVSEDDGEDSAISTSAAKPRRHASDRHAPAAHARHTCRC